jgi:YD repeat-containing protein
MQFDISGGQLDRIVIPLMTTLNAGQTSAGDEAVWDFSYRNVDDFMLLLTSVTSPDGLRDAVAYALEALVLPEGAPRSHMPAVAERTRISVADPSRVIQKSLYVYQNDGPETNFYGYPLVTNWSTRDDQLLHLEGADAYSYGSTETQYEDDSLLCTIERNYNHFHLITNEKTTRGNVVQDVVTDYGIEEGIGFEAQKASFQLPHKVTTTCYDKRHEMVKQITFIQSTYDDVGNVIERVDSATGIVEASAYYPPEGETSAEGIVFCPPDPLGKVRRLKRRTSSPGKNGGPVRSTHYRYTELPARDPARSGVKTIVKVVEEAAMKVIAPGLARNIAEGIEEILWKLVKIVARRGVHKRLVKHWPRARDYYIQASEELSTVLEGNTERVLVHSKQSFVTDLGDQHGSLQMETRTQDDLTETRTFTYASDDVAGTVTTTTTHQAHDNPPIVNTTSETLQFISGLVKSTMDALGNHAEFTYDALGRRKTEVLSPRVEGYEVTTSWNYQLSMSERWVERIGITGLPHRVWMDEQGRTIRREEPLPGGTLVTVHELEYDGLGQLVREVQSDPLRNDPPLHLETRFEYDDWSRCSLMVSPDGSRTVSETTLIEDTVTYGDDVVTRTTQWQEYVPDNEKTGWRSTDVDAADRQRRTAAGTWSEAGEQITESTMSWQYDGVGRCVSMEDPVGNVTLQAWDAHDRLVRTDLPDQTGVLRSYAGGHEDEFIASLTVVPPAIDIEQDLWRAALNAGELLLGTRTWDGLGRLKTENAGSLATSYDYVPGQMSANTKTMPSKDWLQMVYDVRLREVLIGSTLNSADGGTQSSLTIATYDNQLGLPATITAEGVGTMTIVPDYLGRMTYQTVALDGDDTRTCEVIVTPGGLILEKTGTDSVKQIYDYDDKGRVQSITDQDVEVTLVYDALSRLSSRTVRSADGRSVVQGTTYDALGRLSEQSWLHYDTSTPTARKSRLVLRWREDDKVLGRTWYGEDGTPALRTETMEYDARGRLTIHAIEAVDGEHPADEMGNPYVRQVFEHDCLDNLRTVTTTLLDGRVNQTIYAYDTGTTPPNLDRLVGVSNSLSGYPGFGTQLTLTYDDNGNLTNDGQGRKLVWDGAGRLSTVTLADGATTVTYAHGPDGRVSRVTRDQATTFRYREDGAIAYEHESSTKEGRRYIRTEGGVVAETRLAGAIRETFLLGTDPQGSVVTESDPGTKS